MNKHTSTQVIKAYNEALKFYATQIPFNQVQSLTNKFIKIAGTDENQEFQFSHIEIVSVDNSGIKWVGVILVNSYHDEKGKKHYETSWLEPQKILENPSVMVQGRRW